MAIVRKSAGLLPYLREKHTSRFLESLAAEVSCRTIVTCQISGLRAARRPERPRSGWRWPVETCTRRHRPGPTAEQTQFLTSVHTRDIISGGQMTVSIRTPSLQGTTRNVNWRHSSVYIGLHFLISCTRYSAHFLHKQLSSESRIRFQEPRF